MKTGERALGLLWVHLFNPACLLLLLLPRIGSLHDLFTVQCLLEPGLKIKVSPLDLKKNKIQSLPQMQAGKPTGKWDFANKLKYMELLLAL